MLKQDSRAPTAAEEVVAAKLLSVLEALQREGKSHKQIVDEMRSYLRYVVGLDDYQH